MQTPAVREMLLQVSRGSRFLRRVVWRVGLAAAALTFVQADCESVNGLVQKCPGATVQSARFFADGSCGPGAVITVMVATSGLCAITVSEGTEVPLPSMGTFEDNADKTNYELGQGNWVLQNDPTGMLGDNGGLRCTSGTINAKGGLDLLCEITLCSTIGEDLEPTCVPSGSCTTHLTPLTANADVEINDAGVATLIDASN